MALQYSRTYLLDFKRIPYYLLCMSGKASKRPRDMIQLAKRIADIATGNLKDDPYEGKNYFAIETGRISGLKDGKAWAKKLTSYRPSEIAKKAAATKRKKS